MRASGITVVLVAGATLLTSGALHAQNLNVDLGTASSGTTASSAYGAAANQAGTWSRLGLGITSNLPDPAGSATAVAANVTADTDQGFGSLCTGDPGDLLNDNIYTYVGTWTVALSGLTNGTYTVYLYQPTNSAVGSGVMTVNGTAVAELTAHDCSLTEGSTYATVAVNVTDGTLTMTGTSTGASYEYVGISGFQLVFAAPSSPIPATSQAGLLLLGLLLAGAGVALLRR